MELLKIQGVEPSIVINHLKKLIQTMESGKMIIYEITDDECKSPSIYGDDYGKRELTMVYK